jgi:putative isomerase
VWAPLNFLVYLALARTELEDVRRDLAEKSAVLFMKEWTEHRHVHENYNSITGEGCDSGNSDKFYHWGALLCAVALADAGYIKNLGKPLEE